MLLRSYRERWPQVTYELRSLSSDQQVQALLSGDIDLGIGRTAGDGRLVESTRVLVETALCRGACVSSHGKRRFCPPFSPCPASRSLASTTQSHPVSTQSSWCCSIEPALAMSPSWRQRKYTTIVGLVAAGAGVAIVPASVRGFQPEGVRYLAIDDPAADVSLLLLTRPNEHLPLVHRALELAAELF